MSMPPLEDPHGHHHLPPGTTEDDIAAAAAAAVPSALNRKCGNPTCNDWALRGRGECRFSPVLLLFAWLLGIPPPWSATVQCSSSSFFQSSFASFGWKNTHQNHYLFVSLKFSTHPMPTCSFSVMFRRPLWHPLGGGPGSDCRPPARAGPYQPNVDQGR